MKSHMARARAQEDAVMGRLQLGLLGVARAGRLHDRFPLQESDTGEVELCLDWTPATFAPFL
jgi:hypothetical protein